MSNYNILNDEQLEIIIGGATPTEFTLVKNLLGSPVVKKIISSISSLINTNCGG